MTIDKNSDAYKEGYQVGYNVQISSIDDLASMHDDSVTKMLELEGQYKPTSQYESFKSGVNAGTDKANKDRRF